MMTSLLTDPLLERLGYTLLHSLWQEALVSVVAALLLFAMRLRTARLRYLMAYALLLLLLVPPAVTFTGYRAYRGTPPDAAQPPGQMDQTPRGCSRFSCQRRTCLRWQGQCRCDWDWRNGCRQSRRSWRAADLRHCCQPRPWHGW